MMKAVERVALLVGCLSLAVVASASRYTGRDVALAAVVHYNNQTAPPSTFKLLQVNAVKTQSKNQRTLYEVRFIMMEAICDQVGVVIDASDCPSNEYGVRMKCVTKAVQTRSPTRLIILSVRCHQFPVQWELPVLARQQGLP
ncbi:uncharacterized protein LOC144593242 [Rhinoraja longicauda]